MSTSGFLSSKETWTHILGRIQCRDTKMVKAPEYLSYKEKLRELSFSQEKRKLRGDLINGCKYLKGGCNGNRSRLFSLVLPARTRDGGHQLEQKRFHLNIRKHFWAMWMEHRLPRETVEILGDL